MRPSISSPALSIRARQSAARIARCADSQAKRAEKNYKEMISPISALRAHAHEAEARDL